VARLRGWRARRRGRPAARDAKRVRLVYVSPISACLILVMNRTFTAAVAALVLAVALVSISIAHADDLPSELLLQCDGTVKTIITGKYPVIDSSTFSKKIIRIKDRVASVAVNPVLTKNCALSGTSVACDYQYSEYESKLNVTTKARNRLLLSRTTGELNVWLHSLHFDGKTTRGDPDTLDVYWDGVCQTVGKPIF
jgi:hypothetical protein